MIRLTTSKHNVQLSDVVTLSHHHFLFSAASQFAVHGIGYSSTSAHLDGAVFQPPF